MQLQLVSSKMAQMFDTLLRPGLTLPQKRQTCYIWWGVRGEGSWGFGRLSHNLLTLLSLYPPHPSEGPSSTSSLFREKWCCCQQQHGEAYEHSQTQWRKPYMLCSPYTGYIIIITPPLRALPFSLTPSSHGELNCISGLFFGDWLKERKQNKEGKKEKERGGRVTSSCPTLLSHLSQPSSPSSTKDSTAVILFNYSTPYMAIFRNPDNWLDTKKV